MAFKNLENKEILISVARLHDFGGSEITSLELIDYFLQIKCKVSIATFDCNKKFLDYFKKKNVTFYNLLDSAPFQNKKIFELGWIHHSVTAYKLMLNENVTFKKVIFSSLSFFEPIESPPISSIPFDLYLVNSAENYNFYKKNYPAFHHKTLLYPNPAPSRFWELKRANNKILKNIAVISNHIPIEIHESVYTLRSEGFNVDIYGFAGLVTRINPQIIGKYDAVISIGKTVQYCIATKTPIYCYDRFGGDGWLTKKNFNRNMQFNFSGRGGEGSKSSKVICGEIKNGYTTALDDINYLHTYCKKLFVLEDLVSTIINFILNKKNKRKLEINCTDRNLMLRQNLIYQNQKKFS